jgi:hypothetical protein
MSSLLSTARMATYGLLSKRSRMSWSSRLDINSLTGCTAAFASAFEQGYELHTVVGAALVKRD